jgi:hypothetical protein
MFDEETPVAWQAVPREASVVAADGTEIGTAETMLGDLEEDIFHGVVLKRSQDGETVELPAARVKHMTTGHVITDLAPGEALQLTPYRGR